MGKSSYQYNFVDWGISQIPPAVTTNTIRSMPFQGKSSYADTFVAPDLNYRAHPMKKLYFCIFSLSKNRQVTQADKHFNAVTMKMTDFKPFKIQPADNTKEQKKVYRAPSFPGQYISTAMKDYGAKKIEDPCQEKKVPVPPSFNKSTAYFNPLNKLYYV